MTALGQLVFEDCPVVVRQPLAQQRCQLRAGRGKVWVAAQRLAQVTLRARQLAQRHEDERRTAVQPFLQVGIAGPGRRVRRRRGLY